MNVGDKVCITCAQKGVSLMASMIGNICTICERLEGEDITVYKLAEDAYKFHWAEEWLTPVIETEVITVTEKEFEDMFK